MYLFVIFAVLLITWLFLRRGKKLGNFPGPPTLPLLGNVHQIDESRIHLIFDNWAKQYGGVYQVNLMGEKSLVVTHPSLFHELLVTRGSEFAGRPVIHEINWFRSGGCDLGFRQPDQKWRDLRKMSSLSMRAYDKGLERIEQYTDKMTDSLIENICRNKGKPFDPKPSIYLTTMNIITLLLMGRSYDQNSVFFNVFKEHEYLVVELFAHRKLGAIMDKLVWLKPFYDLLGKLGKTYLKSSERFYNLVEQEVLKSEDEGYHASLGSLLKQAEKTGQITRRDATMVSTNIVMAGSVTTANTLHALISVLANHPNILNRLQDEVDEVVGQRRVTLKDKEALPYLQAALLEIGRYLSVNPLGITHAAVQDTTIDGKFVPAKTHIYMNHFGLHHDKRYFPEPYKFKPERFLDDNGQLIPIDHPTRRNLYPFGAGPRVCFGESLTKTRMFLITAAIIQRFDIKGDEVCGMPECDILKFKFQMILYQPDYQVCMVDRNV